MIKKRAEDTNYYGCTNYQEEVDQKCWIAKHEKSTVYKICFCFEIYIFMNSKKGNLKLPVFICFNLNMPYVT